MLIESLIVLGGGALIVFLANLIIKESVSIADHFGLSDTFVGMTILSIGTSLPEIITHIAGSLQIVSDPSVMNKVSSLVIGTNIGSDIFQQNVIIGIVAFFGVLTVIRKKNLPILGGLVGTAVILLLMGIDGTISRLDGGILVIGYLAYLVYLGRMSVDPEDLKVAKKLTKKATSYSILKLTSQFVVMAFTANYVLEAARTLVDQIPISASFFGIVVLGIVAAFPELFTAIAAARKKKTQMSAGILLGSNITNPAFALGIGALISTYKMPSVAVLFDLPFKIATALLLLWFFWKDEKVQKSEAIVLIALFVGYLIVRQVMFPVDVV